MLLESPLDKQKGVRGSQYAAQAYRGALLRRGFVGSIGRSGNPRTTLEPCSVGKATALHLVPV